MQSIFGGCPVKFAQELEARPDEVSAVDREKRTALHAAAYVGEFPIWSTQWVLTTMPENLFSLIILWDIKVQSLVSCTTLLVVN